MVDLLSLLLSSRSNGGQGGGGSGGYGCGQGTVKGTDPVEEMGMVKVEKAVVGEVAEVRMVRWWPSRGGENGVNRRRRTTGGGDDASQLLRCASAAPREWRWRKGSEIMLKEHFTLKKAVV